MTLYEVNLVQGPISRKCVYIGISNSKRRNPTSTHLFPHCSVQVNSKLWQSTENKTQMGASKRFSCGVILIVLLNVVCSSDVAKQDGGGNYPCPEDCKVTGDRVECNGNKMSIDVYKRCTQYHRQLAMQKLKDMMKSRLPGDIMEVISSVIDPKGRTNKTD